MPSTSETPSTRIRIRRRLGVVAVVIAVAGLLGACGDSKYQYVANRQLGSFVRMPTGWIVDDVTNSQGDGRVSALPSGIQSVWKLQFASGVPDPVAAAENMPGEVNGRIEVYQLSDYYRERYSISTLRGSQTVVMAVDPVYPPAEVGVDLVELHAYQPLTVGGATGSRSIANLNAAPEGSDAAWLTQDLTVLFDHDAGKIYVLSMHCSGACYLENQKTIDEIATSFAVRNDV